jgi:hypothetical protein
MARTRLLNYGALILSLIWLLRITMTVTADTEDLGQYWQAAVNIVQTGDPYATTPEPGTVKIPSAVRPQPFPNPPLLAYIMLPIAGLERITAMWLWYCLNLLMLIALAAVALRVSDSAVAQRYWGVVWFALLALGPTRLCLQLGQLGIVLALLAVSGYALVAQRARLAGLMFALGALIKLYPGFLWLFFLRNGPRRVAWWTTGWAAGIGLVSILMHGPAPYQEYVRKVLFGGYYPYQAEFNVSLVGYWRRLLVASDYTDVLVNAPQLALLLTALSAIGVLACAWWAGTGGTKRAHLLQFCTYICVMLLLAPVNGYYNLPLLILPVLAVVKELEQRYNRWVLFGLAAAVTLISIAPTWTDLTPLYDPLHTGWGTLLLTPSVYGQVLLLGLVASLAHQASHTVPSLKGYQALNISKHNAVQLDQTD